ncbi:zinc transport system substrate-binding protein [Laceyella tengchongensis]|uniref:Zinc transport system substrate-binding protein n=1 Tax=Laceyella tengchongensis TaxID=574699 RepID=A0AA45WSH8_9BACL|nr:metal ABC transporter substrate-binding protein [Laceyella tengchongensis]SMP32972.1 zinc transport system substrate-binding protein [Laceyella tengchongensis]
MNKGLIFLAATLLILTGCQPGTAANQSSNNPGKLQVYTSLFPFEDFAKKIGGDHVQVTNLIPPGVEPHDFELTARDMTALSNADLFIYNGVGMEAWAEKAARNLDTKRTLVVETTKNLPLLKREEHDHGDFDPHAWLDPTLAKKQAEAIRDALIKKDAKHAADYRKNFEQVAAELDKLDHEFQFVVKQAPKKEFAVSHAAFGYLAHRYGLKQMAISGLSPSDEPSPQELKRIIEEVREHDIRVILFETLVSSKIAEVVKREVKAEALVLNPLEGLTEEEKAQGMDYFQVMRKNKEHLAKALGVTQ